MAKKTTVAITLREAREEAGLTQSELAAAAGVSRGTIYNWESGRCTGANLDAFRNVAAVLGKRPSRIFLG